MSSTIRPASQCAAPCRIEVAGARGFDIHIARPVVHDLPGNARKLGGFGLGYHPALEEL